MKSGINNFIKNPTVLVLIISLFPVVVNSQWNSDPTTNTAVCDTTENQNFAKIVSDDNGGAYIIWTDHRDESGILAGDIYAQRIKASGYPMWIKNGIVINNGMNAQVVPELISDGAGGFIAVWQLKFGLFYDRDLYAQRVDSSGNLLWNTNGVVISNVGGTEYYQNVIPDGNGGAIIAWQHLPGTPGENDIYAQRVDNNGQTLWASNGITISDTIGSQTYPVQASDDNGGTMIAWSDSRNGYPNIDIYVQHVASNGNVSFASNGISVCNEAAFQDEPVILNDGYGNYIIAWYDMRHTNGDIYIQKVDTVGNFHFMTNGIPVCTDSSEQNRPALISDGVGGFIIAWTDLSDDGGNIYAQRFDSNGNALWTSNGVAICTAADIQDNSQIAPDNQGGAIISWMDYRNEWLGDIYSQRIDSDGNLIWNTNGVAICTATGEQSDQQMISNGSGGSILVWYDTRNGVDENIYAQNVNYLGILGVRNQVSNRTNLNKAISDLQTASDTIDFIFQIEKLQSDIIQNVVVFIDTVFHEADGDLTFTLTHNGVTDTLIHQAGGSENDFIRTVLNDTSSISISSGTAPFTGIYLPYQSLSVFNGMDALGSWILSVYDGLNGNVGTLQAWGISVAFQENPAHIISSNPESPQQFILSQNYPNPFNPVTHIRYDLRKSSNVKIEVFNSLGQKVITLVDTYKKAGFYTVDFNGSFLASGLYFYRIETREFSKVHKMILMK